MSYTTLYLVRMSTGEILAAYENELYAKTIASSWNAADPGPTKYYVEPVDLIPPEKCRETAARSDTLAWDVKWDGDGLPDVELNFLDFPCSPDRKRIKPPQAGNWKTLVEYVRDEFAKMSQQ